MNTQKKTVMKIVRIEPSLDKKFDVRLAKKGEKAQTVLYRMIEEYVK